MGREAASLLPRWLMMISEGVTKRGHETFLLGGIQKIQTSSLTHTAPPERGLSDPIQSYEAGPLCLPPFPLLDKSTPLVPLRAWFPVPSSSSPPPKSSRPSG